MKKHTVFLSWSGSRSRRIAEQLHEWLPDLFPQVDPWLSSQDVDKGTRWLQEIGTKLSEVHFGIVCLTRENLESPWILFEAGAISKLSSARLFTLLHGVHHSDVLFPLGMFQHTKTEKREMQALVRALNKSLGEDALESSRLDKQFERLWPEFEQRLTEIDNTEPPSGSKDPDYVRDGYKMLREILGLVREGSRNWSRDDFDAVGDVESVDGLRDAITSLLGERLKKLGIRWSGIALSVDGETIWVLAKKPDRYYTTSMRAVVDFIFGYTSTRAFVNQVGLRGPGKPGLPHTD